MLPEQSDRAESRRFHIDHDGRIQFGQGTARALAASVREVDYLRRVAFHLRAPHARLIQIILKLYGANCLTLTPALCAFQRDRREMAQLLGQKVRTQWIMV